MCLHVSDLCVWLSVHLGVRINVASLGKLFPNIANLSFPPSLCVFFFFSLYCFSYFQILIHVALLPLVPGMVGHGPPFPGQPNIPSVSGSKLNQPSIATVTTASQPMMQQQQVPPNQQQPVPPPGQAVPSQQQAPPQQQPLTNQPTAASAQPNMVNPDHPYETYSVVPSFFFDKSDKKLCSHCFRERLGT